MVRDAARLLNKIGDAEKYEALSLAIQNAFQKRFYDAAIGGYGQNSQTAQAVPLALGLVPEELREKVSASLVENVAATGNRISSGIVGTPYVLQALTEGGRADLAYAMVAREDGPGWGAMLKNGHGTIIEDWGAGQSLNHPAFTCVSAWFYQGLAGINADPAAPGFKRFTIRPNFVGDLAFVEASYQSPQGLIKSEWTRTGDQMELTVEIPANTRARIWLPVAAGATVTESGQPLDAITEVTDRQEADGCQTFELPSGHYRFSFERNESP